MPKLTKKVVESLKPGEILWADSPGGFGVRCRDSGHRYYFVKYRAQKGRSGRQRWVTIGRHGSPWTIDTAENKALRILGLVADDHDPATKRDWEGALPTLEQFSAEYLKRHAKLKKSPRTVVEDERNLKLHILPALGAIRVDAITGQDVAKFHANRHEHKVNANRCLSLLGHILRMAEKWGLRPRHSNPCRDVEKYEETPRERFLSADELARFGRALHELEKTESASRYALAALRVLVFTGARKTEITTLRWDHVDMARGVARRDTKTGMRTIHLPPPALAILKGLPRIEESPWVFPGARDHMKPVGDLEGAWRKVRASAKLKDVHLHDLRHSFASVAAAGGDSLPVIGAMLGHTQASTTQRYAHLSTDPIAAAAAATAKRIKAAMGAKPAKKNVSPMRRAR